MKLEVWTKPDADRRAFIGGSDARIIIGTHEPTLLHLRREKRGEAEPEDLFGNPRPAQPCDRATTKPSACPIRVAHTELVAALAGNPPRPIRLEVDSLDLDDRAEHVEKMLAAIYVYLTAILADTAQNIPGGKLDRKYLDGLYSDFTGDAVGGIRQAAAEMRQHETWRAS